MDRAAVLTLLFSGIGGVPQPADLVAIGAIVTRLILAISYLSGTLFVGTILVANAGDRTRGISNEIRHHPVETGLFGVGTIVTCVGGYLLLGIFAAGLAELGAPPQVGILVLVPLVIGGVGVIVGTALGQLIVGTILLQRFSDDGRPNLWAALVVGTGIVMIVAILPGGNVLGGAATVLGIGGVSRQMWQTNSDRIPDLAEMLLE